MPRVKIFAGKAAASYHQAKLIIKLANDVAKVVNDDPATRDLLKVVFLPNYNVSLAETIIPAADLSEQISTAGMEASGTGNMKFALNGALTIGTLDGANVEISERVGDDNIFIFGLTAQEVEAEPRARASTRARRSPRVPRLAEALRAIAGGVFSPDDPHRYAQLVDTLTYYDHFLVAKDFDAYYEAQRRVDARWRDQKAWRRSSILNTARVAGSPPTARSANMRKRSGMSLCEAQFPLPKGEGGPAKRGRVRALAMFPRSVRLRMTAFSRKRREGALA